MINSRTKGASGEREIVKILQDELGVKLFRNLEQTRSGGHDLIPEPGSLLDRYAIEIKRYAKISNSLLRGFWLQSVEQAKLADKEPILICRQDRGDWFTVIPLHQINPALSQSNHFDSTAILSVSAFCAVIRESIEHYSAEF